MSLVAEDVALELIRSLRGPLKVIATRDRELESQIRDAASSSALNTGEFAMRVGRDRLHGFRQALGSAGEIRIALKVALAWGYVEPATVAEPERIVDRLIALLWGLTHPR